MKFTPKAIVPLCKANGCGFNGFVAIITNNGINMLGLLKRAVPILLIIAAVIGWKFYNKNSASAEVKEQAMALFQDLPQYEQEREFFETAVSESHDPAFNVSYSMGGRRRGSRFDNEQYHTLLLQGVMKRADAAGKTEIAEIIRASIADGGDANAAVQE